MNSFRDHVIQEAFKQKEFRQSKKSIPAEYRKYARQSGLWIFVVGTLGTLVLLAVGTLGSVFYIGGVLFTGTFAVGGLLQLITGLHLLTRR